MMNPQGACLIRALTGYILLRLVRGKGRIRLGILTPTNSLALQAHAWLECDGEVLIGEPMSGSGALRAREPQRRLQAT